MQIQRLKKDTRLKFSAVIRQLERAPPVAFRSTLGEVGTFIQQVRSALRKGVELPHVPTPIRAMGFSEGASRKKIVNNLVSAKLLLTRVSDEATKNKDEDLFVGLDSVLPIYEDALECFRCYSESDAVAKALKDHRTLYAVYRLWTPGIMTIRELAQFAEQKENVMTNVIKSLRTCKIIAPRTRGIWGRGELGQLAMNLFAIMVVLWRSATDQYYDLQVIDVSHPVKHVIPFSGSLTDALRELPNLQGISPSEPIIIDNSPDSYFYLNPEALLIMSNLAMDSYLDGESANPMLANARIESLFRKIELVSPRMKVGKAYLRGLSQGGMVFVKIKQRLFYLPLHCPHVRAHSS